MATVGYARVSSVGQSLQVQLDKLQECEKVFQEKRSGVSNSRPQLTKCLDYLREGDTLMITKLDRLARSTLHLTQIIDQLKENGIELKVLDQAIDTSTPTGKLLFHVLAAIAEFETEIRKERQMEGIAKAKERGVHIGRKPKISAEQAQELREKRSQGALIKELMSEYGLSKSHVYRLLATSK
ncbi:MAG: recombinase family protein [Sedimenticola sp.]